jgi:hypothetical protein
MLVSRTSFIQGSSVGKYRCGTTVKEMRRQTSEGRGQPRGSVTTKGRLITECSRSIYMSELNLFAGTAFWPRGG